MIYTYKKISITNSDTFIVLFYVTFIYNYISTLHPLYQITPSAKESMQNIEPIQNIHCYHD